MPRGYAGKFADIDLTTGRITETKFSDEVLRQYVGGRALAAKILWDRLGEKWEKVDPLGPENILLVLTGPMTCYYPGARVCVTGKSPQSNGIIASTVATEVAMELKTAGYDGLIISGKAKSPVYILVTDNKVEIKDAKHIWGKNGQQTLRAVTKETREELQKRLKKRGLQKEPAVLYIGPAGDNKSRIAAVMVKWAHGCGYGGYGGVMGSKNLKAIAVKGSGPMPDVADWSKVRELIDRVYEFCFANDGMRRWGTGAAGYSVGAETSSEPVRNWQEEWHDERSYGVDKFERKVWAKRYWGDQGCPTTCEKLSVVREGPLKGAITDNPDYETQAYAGTNLGIFQPEGDVYVNAAIENAGLCGIQGGNILGFAGELYQRKILTKKDIGFDLKWGDPKAFAALAEKIGRREGIGDILAEGTYRAALKISKMKGVDVTKYAVQAKGVAIGAHGTRSGMDYVTPIAYTCSVQSGDHTSPAAWTPEGPRGELSWGFTDTAVICLFNAMPVPESVQFEFYKAVTGWELTPEKWYGEIALRMVAMQRAALLIGGPDAKWKPADDENPPRFYEPLPSGPKKGQTTDKAKVAELKRKYYEAVGWDEKGIPRSSTLKKLGLESVDKALEKVRK